ncbi:hypothetical protein DSO57_1001373 [Entomophthora muscae]|uniref:Uncharacterized protein n=2 Tax=Entomophthora muscae TaxID=34485 RepID=A0ACC2SY43_9FUNG|nr:hypothetical protein DSO57_1001373 [Entomophthora muscae]
MAGNRVNITRNRSGTSFVRPTVERKIFVYPDFLRYKGSVIPSVILPVFLLTLFAFGVAFVDHHYQIKLDLPNSIVPSLSVVVGLLLVFRTNTAYDRYYEGRRLWTVIKSSTRNFARSVYMIHSSDIQAKKDTLNLAVAFNYATKLYLRDELQERHRELDSILTTPLLSSRFRHSQVNSYTTESGSQPLPGVARMRDQGLASEYSPLRPKFSPVYQSGYVSVSSVSETMIGISEVHAINLPIEIIYYMNEYVDKQRQENNIDPQTNNNMNSTLSTLVECLGGLERIMRTPIPLAYLIHLKQAVTLYLLFLPFTLTDLDFMLVPLIAIVAFTLYGIDAIGQEIENPFGYDPNDLPLDFFCQEIHDEIKSILIKLGPDFTESK